MSRYDYPGSEPGTRVSVGWDRPLRTFFVHVVREAGPEAEPGSGEAEPQTIVWLGTSHGELAYATDAIRVGRKHGELPPDIGMTLETDRLRTAGTTDGPAQQASRPFLSEE